MTKDIAAYHLIDHVAWIDLADGPNLLSLDFMDNLMQILQAVEKDTDATVLVLSSKDPKFFCNGFDLEDFKEVTSQADREKVRNLFNHMNRLFRYLLGSPLINIAAMNGHVFGGGAVLACACDYRIMREDRGFFCLPEIDLGIFLLPSSLALIKKAAPSGLWEDLLLSGRRLSGTEGLARRLFHRVCSLETLPETALEMARGLNKKRDHIMRMKRQVNREIVALMDQADPASIEEMVSLLASR